MKILADCMIFSPCPLHTDNNHKIFWRKLISQTKIFIMLINDNGVTAQYLNCSTNSQILIFCTYTEVEVWNVLKHNIFMDRSVCCFRMHLACCAAAYNCHLRNQELHIKVMLLFLQETKGGSRLRFESERFWIGHLLWMACMWNNECPVYFWFNGPVCHLTQNI